jgi:hypothetical protein
MVARGAVLAALAGLAGLGLPACSPSVGDCQVRCAADTELCPDGQSCLEGMCRVEGASGSCDQAGDGDGGQGDPDAGPPALTVETQSGVTDGAPIFLAVQDGDGAWQPRAGAGPHVVPIDSGSYGVLYVCPIGDTYLVTFLYATLVEARTIVAACAEGDVGPAAIDVEVQSAPDTPITVYAAHTVATGTPATLPYLAATAHDVVVTSLDTDNSFYGWLIERDVTAAEPAPQVTMSISDAVPPAWTGYSITGLTGGESLVDTEGIFLSDGGTSAALPTRDGAEYGAVAGGTTTGNDIHSLATVTRQGDSIRLVRVMTRDPEDLVLALPAAVGFDAPTFTDGPVEVRPTVPVTLPQGALAFTASFDQVTDPPRAMSLFISAGWAEAVDASVWTMPDLSTVAGWDSAYGLQSGPLIDWTAGATSTNRSVDDLIELVAVPCAQCRRFPRLDWDGRRDEYVGSAGTLGGP